MIKDIIIQLKKKKKYYNHKIFNFFAKSEIFWFISNLIIRDSV